ncbi:MAG: GGDEF domain-containing protein [Treponema sp.]|nr:GGDEF domain-containing protein [Treponema sp.]
METNKIKSGPSIIAAICIVIYVLALVQGAFRIYLSVEDRKITAEQEFSNMVDLALSAGIQGFMDERFVQTINTALSSSKSIEAVIITGPDNSYAFEKQSGRAVSWVNNTPRFINRFTFSNQSHYRPLAIADLRNANIKAVAGALDYDKFVKILKETLLIILFGFAFSFFTMLIKLLLEKRENPELIPVRTPNAGRTANRDSEDDDIPVSVSSPKGLYSTRSGLGWEDYIQERLDSELHRCSSTEKDLAFIAFEFTDMPEDRLFKQTAQEAIKFFSSKDLIFEYGDMGIAVILPGAGLETAIPKSENFYQRILNRFPNSYTPAFGLNIGLSSRSGRLLNAERLMLEATEALKKAKSDSKTSIIAFKSDPEKYRAFIASQS